MDLVLTIKGKAHSRGQEGLRLSAGDSLGLQTNDTSRTRLKGPVDQKIEFNVTTLEELHSG